ncbi:hypothetical protein JTB14_023308 [Gonioctena quinquepunctata]|nr:hypothetical protein JTB14_023308 [Gonioctena quinquepunctata]
MKKRTNHFGVILDGDCDTVTYILNENTDRAYFYETYHWLILSQSEDISSTFHPLKLNINSDVHLAVSKGNTGNISIFDVYNPASEHGGDLRIEPLGYYNEFEGYKAKYTQNKYWERRNMTGVVFKSAIVVNSKFTPQAF